ncbi:cupin domain-containing protein [Rubripirellula reticaptiva]|uniref:Quercetin 2,3-dioxygenase n=1 Tax=Rubripirellula reticaptiva TaxID=2528013 RepID=A0A5C6EWT3_9BACT|nr:cupin domain-containing protein [Rubripirellula reticaptiva]TWU51701.1 Quercetin 2,3-dioxygenase [Rubripirellula reticaptiva]
MILERKFVLPGEGTRYDVLGGDQVTIKVTSRDTGGEMTVLETVVPAGAGPPRHVHTRESETFYVLEGDFEFEVDGERTNASAGAFLIAPPNLPHSFRNVSNKPGKLLVVVQPGGFEEFIEKFASLPTDQPPDMSKMAQMGAEHGVTFLPPAQ